MQRLYETGLIDRVRGGRGSIIRGIAARRAQRTRRSTSTTIAASAALSHVFARVVSSASHEVRRRDKNGAIGFGLHL